MMENHFQKTDNQNAASRSLEFFKIYGISMLLALVVVTSGRLYFQESNEVVFEKNEVERHESLRPDLQEVGSVSAALLKQVKILVNNKSF